jgi:hypothetical protein
MAKTATPVNEGQMKTAIALVEKDGPLGNLSVLYDAVAAEYKKLVPDQDREVTASVVLGWIKKNEYPVKTQPGKRGGGLQPGHRPTGTRTSRADKFAKNPEVTKHFERIRKNVPENYLPLVEKAAGGSITAAVKLKCLDCTAFQREEIRGCKVGCCSLWPVRPFQSDAEDEEGEEVAEETTVPELAIAV